MDIAKAVVYYSAILSSAVYISGLDASSTYHRTLESTRISRLMVLYSTAIYYS